MTASAVRHLEMNQKGKLSSLFSLVSWPLCARIKGEGGVVRITVYDRQALSFFSPQRAKGLLGRSLAMGKKRQETFIGQKTLE
jgi:hypothetical protein